MINSAAATITNALLFDADRFMTFCFVDLPLLEINSEQCRRFGLLVQFQLAHSDLGHAQFGQRVKYVRSGHYQSTSRPTYVVIHRDIYLRSTLVKNTCDLFQWSIPVNSHMNLFRSEIDWMRILIFEVYISIALKLSNRWSKSNGSVLLPQLWSLWFEADVPVLVCGRKSHWDDDQPM